MENLSNKAVQDACSKHPRTITKAVQYGTAGFRSNATELDFVLYRMGLLAVLRSKYKKATIGVMITASHNPECDNGVKLVDPFGEMLEFAWEKLATDLVNVSDAEVGLVLQSICTTCSIDWTVPAQVFIGRDTRPSSPPLAQAVVDGIAALQGQCTDYGVLTTPQLHYMVRCYNSNGDYGVSTEQGYYDKLCAAFLKLRGSEYSIGGYSNTIKLDGANGVGAYKMGQIQKLLGGALNIQLGNDGTSGKLNYKCGADFVKVQQMAPEGVAVSPADRCASFDGDADRIVYFYSDGDDVFRLLDGDKIATLVAGYLGELVAQSGLELNLGLVQTAYANGSSTDYIVNKLRVPVACVPTGVKHLHHKAMEFDIGVYFEANGHGTVLFSDKAMEKIGTASSDGSGESAEAATRLRFLIDLINQTVGDAISDMLLVETILHSRGWSIDDWNRSYKDLPNRQLKVKVKDRTVIQTTDAERRTTQPAGLQAAIDKTVSKYTKGRSFVRPSGTEDVVRVYAEADTQARADQLANQVAVLVYDMGGGVGDRPT